MADGENVTRLLQKWQDGDSTATEQLMPLVYDQLRTLAARHMRPERIDHTLSPTALVHEAYLKLAGADVCYENRLHFYAIAARVMRRILLDHARGLNRVKRGSGAVKVPLDDDVLKLSYDDPVPLLELDAALDRLAVFDQRKAELVELLFFGGLTYDEAAAALKISVTTVDRDLRMAKAWLHQEMLDKS